MMDRKIRSIDFARLSLRDALDLATLVEEEARDRYEEFAEQMDLHHNPDAARFFRFMHKNEEHHRATLAGRRQELFGDEATTVRREMIFDVEAPEYDEARAFMSTREALEAVMRAEVKAHDFFAAALAVVEDAEVRKLFDELRAEELHHQELVSKEMAKLPADDSGVKAEDYADEPVGQ